MSKYVAMACRRVVLIVAVLALTACKGGGGGGSSSSSAVEGVATPSSVSVVSATNAN